MRRSRTRLAPLAVAALLALSAAAPAAAAAKTHRLGAGTATFSLDPTETGKFLGMGIPPYPIFPARIAWSATAVTLRIPITGGTWTTGAGAHGTFLLGGGLAYVDPDMTTPFDVLDLTRWRAGVNTSAGISVLVNGVRTSNFFDENLMGSIPSVVTIHGHKYAKVTGVLLFFNTTSATAITTMFVTGPASGDPFGSATFLARLKT